MDLLHTKENLKKLTFLSYALTCLTGIAVILPFVVTQPAANYFHSQLGYIGFIFSFFMFGMMCGQAVNGFLVKHISIRVEIYLSTAIYLVGTSSMFFIHQPGWLAYPLSVIGFCFGLFATLPNFIIVHAFDGKQRSAKLNRLDLFFSIGSLLYPMVAGWMLMHFFPWQSIYLSVMIVFVAVVVLCARAILPNVAIAKISGTKFSPWTLNIWLVGLAIFLYFMSYVGYTYWIATDLTQTHHVNVASADFGVSLFWIMYAVGCLLSSFVVHYIAVNRYIIISATIALIAYYFVAESTTIMEVYLSISLLGLSCATVYSSSISYGTLLVERPSPRIVAFFITLSGIGTYLGQVYSSWVESHFGIHDIVYTSALLMAFAITLYIVVSLREKRNHTVNTTDFIINPLI